MRRHGTARASTMCASCGCASFLPSTLPVRSTRRLSPVSFSSPQSLCPPPSSCCARVSVRAHARVMCALPIAQSDRERRDRGGRTPPPAGLDPVRRQMKLKAFKRMLPPRRRKVGGASIRLNSVELAVHVGLTGGSDGWAETLRDREVVSSL